MPVLSRRHLLECHVQAPVGSRERDHVLEPWLEGCRPKRQVSPTGGAEPVHFAQLEVVEHGLGESVPLMREKDALAERAPLARPVEAENGPAVIRRWLQKGVELFDERVVTAVENERGQFLAFSRQTKSRQMPTGIGN